MGRGAALTGVIFDCDGTLVDSEPLAGETWRQVARGHTATRSPTPTSPRSLGSPYARTHAFFAERAALPDAPRCCFTKSSTACCSG